MTLRGNIHPSAKKQFCKITRNPCSLALPGKIIQVCNDNLMNNKLVNLVIFVGFANQLVVLKISDICLFNIEFLTLRLFCVSAIFSA